MAEPDGPVDVMERLRFVRCACVVHWWSRHGYDVRHVGDGTVEFTPRDPGDGRVVVFCTRELWLTSRSRSPTTLLEAWRMLEDWARGKRDPDARIVFYRA